MIEAVVNFLQINVLPWGAIGVFFASIIEEVIPPIPSSLVMSTSGFLLVSGPFSWNTILSLVFKVAVPAAFGVTLGSYPIYFIARFGGKIIIEKWGKYVGLYWSDIEKLKNRLNGTRRDEVFIGIARAIPFVPSVAVSAFCGIVEMNIMRYFFVSFMGIFIRGLIVGATGWQVGHLYVKYAEIISIWENFVLISTVAAVAVFIMLKYKSRPKIQ